MRRRRFGNTDLEVSEVTFGAMRFVPGNKGNRDEAEGRRALETALEMGVDTIHSSHEYGTRYGLEKVLRDHPGRHTLKHVIKVHAPNYDDPAFDAGKFQDQIELGLKELHTDRIDVVQHLQRSVPKEIIYEAEGEPPRIRDMPAVNEALLKSFNQMREAGKVGHLVTFPHTPGFAKAAIASGAFEGMVAFFNLVETELYPMLDDMQRRGMGMFSMRPLREGILTDKRKDRARLPAGDPHLASTSDDAYRRFEVLQRAIGDEVRPWSDLAIKFSLAHPLFCSVIVSMNTVDQVKSVLGAADGNYPDTAFVERVHGIVSRA
jgi:aryl-alcohol dehydrogenase-like predicted oxidoreductase